MADSFRDSYDSQSNYALRPSYLTERNYAVRTESIPTAAYRIRYQVTPELNYAPRAYQPSLMFPTMGIPRLTLSQPEERLEDLPFEVIIRPFRKAQSFYPAQIYVLTKQAVQEPRVSLRDELAELVAQELQAMQPQVMQHV